MNLTKEVKNLYSENYRTLKRKLRKTQINGSIYGIHGLEEINIIKMSTLPRSIYRFNAIPIKIPIAYFTDLDKQTNISKIYMEPKKTPNSLRNLEEKEQSRRDHNT